MKILKKISIIVISITCITVLLNVMSSISIIKMLAKSEIERNTVRNNTILDTFEQIKNTLSINSNAMAEIFMIYDYNKNNDDTYLQDKLNDFEYPDVYILNNEFKITDILKNEYDFLGEDDFKEISNVLNDQFLYDRNKQNFSCVVSTLGGKYIVNANKLNNKEQYLLVVNPLTKDIFKKLKGFSDSISIIDNLQVSNIDSDMKFDISGRTVYIEFVDDSIISYANIESYGDGGDIYISLKEEVGVFTRVKIVLTILIAAIASVSIVSGIIMYSAIKRTIVNRVLKLNRTVTEVIETSDLSIKIEEDNGKDEISILTRDLNSMFSVLKNYSEELKYISQYDKVTKLLNRRTIEAIGNAWIRDNQDFSLAFIDIDNFKLVNDSLGHNVGDEILCTIADILNEFSDEDVRIGRLGGDEFILMIKGENNKERIIFMIEAIFKQFKYKKIIHNFIFEIKASVGINHLAENGSTMTNMLQYADIAMYNVKKRGGNSYCIFNKSLLKPLEYESKVKDGLSNNEFQAYFQPIYNIEDGRIIGAEALIRWRSHGEIIQPDIFIPTAKKTGDIVEIDKLILKQSCELIRQYKEHGIEDFQVSINGSLKLLRQDTFLQDTLALIDEYGIKPSNLKIEITEDETIDDLEYMINLLKEIRNAGIEVALDDFGTGYSSFNYIKTLPLDVIKIDKSFLMDLEHDNRTESILQTIINLAHILELTVTCEGVETKKQFELLRKLNCDTLQGYYFSRPLSRIDFEEFFVSQN